MGQRAARPRAVVVGLTVDKCHVVLSIVLRLQAWKEIGGDGKGERETWLCWLHGLVSIVSGYSTLRICFASIAWEAPSLSLVQVDVTE
jgi:hypothetical protein